MASMPEVEYFRLLKRVRNVIGYLSKKEITTEEAVEKIIDIILQIKFL